MHALYDLPAPAKVNLFLHVVGRRADGYHLLQSAFALIDWCDRLHIDRRPQGLSREDLGPKLPDDDLCLRAARLLQSATGCTQGAHIQIDKQVPAEAGLGGGSSDAATCLLALNRLWGLGLTAHALAQLAQQLGADVPFFIHGRNAWVEGIGEHIQPIDLPPTRLLVVKPAQGLATQKIFSAETLRRNTKRATVTDFAADPFGFFEKGRNDLQPVAQEMLPELGKVLNWYTIQGLKPRMTGSGSAVFALLQDDVSIELPQDTNWQFRVCQTLAQHPLLGWAQQV
ncbi:4-(cytidine 5'-diphospho)-2-C-methyl-D-erythritol kinase [Comamonas serinivorans]|uniref:4-diphosphocytidyl-2-C-methyl-D-erythritol kinase n=1 Tax=Comamonas serinivorans TaxID=1082851 RepID=A0A1Y0ERC9_9BURK|nr:4-(cytidine 5'-diphospho)-2-C-methyl-D-erythritol kinase [Comamonas serinivorans]ARU06058.1 4-(cytidine 5'-diphospho)-2-C-methyl-D-erythritol kinase [Comamonas serinivorans]